VELDPAALPPGDAYRLLVSVVVPRPIALVTTLGEAGANAAPFSFFNAVCSDPPMVAFSAGVHPGREKDTVRNLRVVPEFVVHLVSETLAGAMNVCAIEFPEGEDEIAAAGLTRLPAARVRPPRIAEAPVHLECRVAHVLPLGRDPHHLVIGEVVQVQVRDDLVGPRHEVDVQRLAPIGRLGGRGGYCHVRDTFEMPRIRYADWRRGQADGKS
jgi:flavin reductase (DIM6/NTAB) family NADH-FMN oxidoreductase RutF